MSAGRDRSAGATKARVTPKAMTSQKMGAADVGSVLAYQASPTDTAASPTSAMAATRRRSNRSATAPVTSTSSAAGANSASPRRPRANSLRVRS